MSLVDYDVSSSDEDDGVSAGEEEPKKNLQRLPPPLPPSQRRGPKEEASAAPSVSRNLEQPESSLAKQEETSGLPPPMIEKLPDASFLLNSPTIPLVSGNDHASRVAAARAEGALRKRGLHKNPSSLPRSKLPRGNLPHSKNIPETVGSMLMPPQLKGRSNVATEDIGKLFVKKQPESGATGSANQT